MRIFLIVLSLFSFVFGFSQNTSTFTVLDSVSHNPLELATVRFLKSDYTVFTDAKGNFSTVPQGESEAEVSYIGYKTKIIVLGNTNTIVLQSSANELSGIVLESKKIKYSNVKNIKSVSKPDEYFGFQFGTENCTYVSNSYNKRGSISGITLYLSKLKDMNFIDRTLGRDKNCKGCKIDYVASFKVSFYEYDTITKKPGHLLYDKDIIVDPKNKTYKYSIDLNALNIPFPKNGVCVGVELINTKYTKPKTTFALIGPALGFYKGEVKNEPVSWIRYRKEGWDFKNILTRYNNQKKSNVLAVDVKIKI